MVKKSTLFTQENTPQNYHAHGGRRMHAWLGRQVFRLTSPGQWILLPLWKRAYVFLEYDNEVLVIKNWFSRGEWSLPGGGIGRREDSVHAAIREIYEELGFALKAEQLRELTEGYSKRFIGGKRFVIFYVRLSHKPTVRIKKSELVGMCWMPFKDFKKFSPLSYEVKKSLKARSDISRKRR